MASNARTAAAPYHTLGTRDDGDNSGLFRFSATCNSANTLSSAAFSQSFTEARMPRHTYTHVPGALYHVTLRGAHRREVYFTLGDRRLLITIIGEVVERFAGQLHCYDSAEDSLQLLIQVGEEP